jgi:crotonobetainyl-CoA:carnitine CoA-transferase CaiB-like acyl-CoA transferase
MNDADPLPLEGIKVVDLSQMIAGPSAAVLLADYGAEVIKIEPPEGDGGRQLRSSAAVDLPEAPVFTAYNRNKRSIRLDLRKTPDRERAWQLIEKADVLILSSRPGAMEKLGFGPQQALQRCPRLIYAAISGFGEVGPGRVKRGVDLIVQAESGIMAATGLPDMPVKVGFTVVDSATGHALTHGILAALLRRERTGKGSYLRTSLYEVALHLQAGPIVEYMTTGVQVARSGNSAPLSAPAGAMRCRDGSIVLSAYLENHWRALTRVIGAEELQTDPRFATGAARAANRQALTDLIEKQLATRSAAQWQKSLQQAGVLVGEIKNYAAIIRDPCTTAAGIIESSGNHHSVRNPITFPGEARPAATSREECEPHEAAFR